MTNTYMLGGDKSPEEIVASMKKGLVRHQLWWWPGRHHQRQVCVFCQSEAYWVENGKIQYPVKGATLVGKWS